MKNLIPILFGCIVGVLFIFLMEALSHSLYPLPDGIDPSDTEQMKKAIAAMPDTALFIVLGGYFLASFIGGLVASFLKKTNISGPVLIIATIFTLLGLVNTIMVPHPFWFIVAVITVYYVGAFLAITVFNKFLSNAKKS